MRQFQAGFDDKLSNDSRIDTNKRWNEIIPAFRSLYGSGLPAASIQR